MKQVLARISVVLFLAFAGAALAVTFTSAEADNGDSCGYWFDRKYSEEEVRQTLDELDLDRVEEGLDVPGEFGNLSRELAGAAGAYVEVYEDCKQALDSKRNWSLGLSGLALAVPAALWFIGRANDDELAH